MKYVSGAMKQKGYPEGGIAPGTNGKIFRMILNAPYVQLAKTSFLWLSRQNL